MNNSVISIGPKRRLNEAKPTGPVEVKKDGHQRTKQTGLIDSMFAQFLINDEKSGK